MPAAEETSRSHESFPWRRALAFSMGVWLALTAAGILGGFLAERLYDARQAPPPPYTTQQVQAIQRVAPAAATVARNDVRLWAEGVDVGRDLARAEGTLLGATLMTALWAIAATVWAVRQVRRRMAPLAG